MLTVYVPAQNSELRQIIAPGSGIVGSAVETEEGPKIRIDFEGNIYGADNIKTFGDRVYQAVSRHGGPDQPPYPTTARRVVDPHTVKAVGHFDQKEGRVIVEDQDALLEWLERDRLLDEELKAGGATFERRRRIKDALGSQDPRKRAMARQMQKREQRRQQARSRQEEQQR